MDLYQVDYNDQGNFIYRANKTLIDYKNKEVNALKLYMVHYNKDIFRVEQSDITSFPVYPNMTVFFGGNNKLTSFPIQPKMRYFNGDNNQLTSFPVQPEMTRFYGKNNYLTLFPIQPKMTHFYGNGNKLSSFPVQPEMTHFYANKNQLKNFPVQPKMFYFESDNIKIKIPDENLPKKWIHDWILSSHGKKKYLDLPTEYENNFPKIIKSYTVYRGLIWSEKDIKEHLKQFHDNLDYEKIKVGNVLKLKLKDITSWTTDPKTAEEFAKEEIMYENRSDYGLVLMARVKPQDVLLDLEIANEPQKEIVLKPGTFKCTIFKTFNHKKNDKDEPFKFYKDTNID